MPNDSFSLSSSLSSGTSYLRESFYQDSIPLSEYDDISSVFTDDIRRVDQEDLHRESVLTLEFNQDKKGNLELTKKTDNSFIGRDLAFDIQDLLNGTLEEGAKSELLYSMPLIKCVIHKEPSEDGKIGDYSIFSIDRDRQLEILGAPEFKTDLSIWEQLSDLFRGLIDALPFVTPTFSYSEVYDKTFEYLAKQPYFIDKTAEMFNEMDREIAALPEFNIIDNWYGSGNEELRDHLSISETIKQNSSFDGVRSPVHEKLLDMMDSGAELRRGEKVSRKDIPLMYREGSFPIEAFYGDKDVIDHQDLLLQRGLAVERPSIEGLGEFTSDKLVIDLTEEGDDDLDLYDQLPRANPALSKTGLNEGIDESVMTVAQLRSEQMQEKFRAHTISMMDKDLSFQAGHESMESFGSLPDFDISELQIGSDPSDVRPAGNLSDVGRLSTIAEEENNL